MPLQVHVYFPIEVSVLINLGYLLLRIFYIQKLNWPKFENLAKNETGQTLKTS